MVGEEGRTRTEDLHSWSDSSAGAESGGGTGVAARRAEVPAPVEVPLPGDSRETGAKPPLVSRSEAKWAGLKVMVWPAGFMGQEAR